MGALNILCMANKNNKKKSRFNSTLVNFNTQLLPEKGNKVMLKERIDIHSLLRVT